MAPDFYRLHIIATGLIVLTVPEEATWWLFTLWLVGALPLLWGTREPLR
jgi:hypothetical protein